MDPEYLKRLLRQQAEEMAKDDAIAYHMPEWLMSVADPNVTAVPATISHHPSQPGVLLLSPIIDDSADAELDRMIREWEGRGKQ